MPYRPQLVLERVLGRARRVRGSRALVVSVAGDRALRGVFGGVFE
ncbi:MAG TPA: hypothetical protein VLE53_18765 [Gemmatimonadaceae bacterium]|nr:hypothetical protein [Gemmatimonadaceae bacterium]